MDKPANVKKINEQVDAAQEKELREEMETAQTAFQKELEEAKQSDAENYNKLQPADRAALFGALARVEKHTEKCKKVLVLCKEVDQIQEPDGMAFLNELEDAVKKLKEASEELLQTRDVCDDGLADLGIVEAELKSYVPKDATGRPHREMTEVIKEFVDLVQVRMVSVENLKTAVKSALEAADGRLEKVEKQIRTERELADLEEEEEEEELYDPEESPALDHEAIEKEFYESVIELDDE